MVSKPQKQIILTVKYCSSNSCLRSFLQLIFTTNFQLFATNFQYFQILSAGSIGKLVTNLVPGNWLKKSGIKTFFCVSFGVLQVLCDWDQKHARNDLFDLLLVPKTLSNIMPKSINENLISFFTEWKQIYKNHLVDIKTIATESRSAKKWKCKNKKNIICAT